MASFDLWPQAAVLLLLLALGGAVLIGPRARRAWWSYAAALLLALAGGFGLLARGSEMARESASREQLSAEIPRLELPGQKFVRSDSCEACHPREYSTWHDSYHRTMTQAATPQAVIPDLEGVALSSRGREYRFDREADEFFVTMPDPDWEHDLYATGVHPNTVPNPPMARKRIVMTTGSHNQQTYWVASSKGRRLLNVPWMYLTAEQRWVPREDVFLRPPNGGRKFDRWNDNCIECHSTAGEIGYDKATGTFETAAAELGIACEACHGPAEEHIRANQDPARRYRLRLSGEHDTTIVNPARLDAERSSWVCSQCHAMNVFMDNATRAGLRYRAGGDLTETRMVLRTSEEHLTEAERKHWPRLAKHLADMPASFLPDRFWPDGAVRVSGRDYNSMSQSACFKGGELSCLSCHSMHSAGPVDQLINAEATDENCFQCHSEFRTRIAEHTHHAPGSAGASCNACHMPRTIYGLMKGIRSHQIDSPSVATAIRTGRPDACTLCHVNQPLAWTAARLHEWHGHEVPELTEEQRTCSAAALWLLTGDAHQRAIIADAMGQPEAQQAAGRGWMAPLLAPLLGDPYAAVRFIAHRSLRTLPGLEAFEFDFVGPPEAIAGARDRAMARWTATRPPVITGAGPAVLFDAAGAPDRAEIARLLLRRDDRAMDLRE